MTTILALTVGGSHLPLVAAAERYRPDHILFVASEGKGGSRAQVDGPGTPCRLGDQAYPNLVTQMGLSDGQYSSTDKLLDADDLPGVYAICRQALRDMQARFPGARCIADYTGGTKTMSAGLVLAALEGGWEISLVRASRPSLVTVTEGTEIAGLVNAWVVRCRQEMAEARHLFNLHAYASASELLSELLTEGPIPPELRAEMQPWIVICRGLDAWDRFDHATAQRLLASQQARIVPQWIFLKQLTSPNPGYALVLDLVRNAERRAARDRYDDAVARLYRALELLAQTRLRQLKPALESGNLDVSALPAGLQATYEKRRDPADGRIKLALWDSYELLQALGDPLGGVFAAHRERLLDRIRHRNESILAHGLTPVSAGDWQTMKQTFDGFLAEALAALGVKPQAAQFPRWEDEP